LNLNLPAPEYDVAISFASENEAIAEELRKLLQPPLNVFLWSKAQEHLAGRDGIEVFRTTFRERATLVVVLFAAPWGETAWTRVEETGIKELGLDRGWEHLLFVRLNNSDPVPRWVPRPHLYLNYEAFGMNDLVGAIKLKLAELGVETRAVTPGERAAAQERQRAFDAETIELLTRPPWIFDGIVNDLLNSIKQEADQVGQETGWQVSYGPAAIIGGFAVSSEKQAIQLRSGRTALNSTGDINLILSEFNQPLTIAEPGKNYHSYRAIRSVRSRRLELRRLPTIGWCWELESKVMPVNAAAAAVMHILLDRIEAGRGQPDPDFFEPDE
jgi:hypothetical protein